MPYIQKFIHDNKVVKKTDKKVMTEIYVQDVFEGSSNKLYFTNSAYKNSIFYKVQTQDDSLTFANSFAATSPRALNTSKNLPFFNSDYIYNYVGLYDSNKDFYIDSFHVLYETPESKLIKLDPKYKITNIDNTLEFEYDDVIYQMKDDIEPINVFKRIDPTDNNFYQVGLDQLEKIALTSSDTINKPTEERLYNKVYSTTKDEEALQVLFSIIVKFLRSEKKYTTSTGTSATYPKFVVDEEMRLKLNNLNFENSFKDYMFLPMVIYILKDSIT